MPRLHPFSGLRDRFLVAVARHEIRWVAALTGCEWRTPFASVVTSVGYLHLNHARRDQRASWPRVDPRAHV